MKTSQQKNTLPDVENIVEYIVKLNAEKPPLAAGIRNKKVKIKEEKRR